MTDWTERANCRDWPTPDDWFPVERSVKAPPEMVAVCSACPVATECFRFAMENQMEGIWGGTTSAQRQYRRRHLNRKRNPDKRRHGAPRPVCGTAGGARSHRYYGETVCEPCAKADQEYKREARAKRREQSA